MKKTILILTIFAFIASSCKQATKNQMTMTLTPNEETAIAILGYGTATINWGDGSPAETIELKSYEGDNDDYTDMIYRHKYSETSSCKITITGKNIEHLLCDGLGLTTLDVSQNAQLITLDCSYNQLTSLDVGKNTKLKRLRCTYNQLKKLDLSNNAELYFLECNGNNLSAAALNALFKSLNDVDDYKHINIENNPGTAECQISIAEEKGWIRIDSEGNYISDTQAEENSIAGRYRSSEDPNCNIFLIIDKSEDGGYSFTLLVGLDNSEYNGKVTVYETGIVLEGIPWVSNLGALKDGVIPEDEKGEPTYGIDFVWEDGNLTMQNYGNSMNYYVKLSCGNKYITLTRE